MVPGLVLAHESRAVKASIALFPGLQVGGPACACEETEFSGPVWQVRCAEDGVVQRAEKEEVLMADKNLFLPGTKVGMGQNQTPRIYIYIYIEKYMYITHT